MKRMIFAVLVGLVFSSQSFATIASGAQLIIDQVDPNLNIGIEVRDVSIGTTLFKHNQDRYFIPASNMKLFSDAAALMVLGPDYQFKNTLSTSCSQLQQGVLKGSIYLHLPGDPSFSRERLSHLIDALKEWPVHRIVGNIVIDSAHAVVAPYAPGGVVKDRIYAYGAPISPLMIDANRLLVTVNPASSVGAPALVEVEADRGDFVINNQVTTREGAKHCGVDFSMDQDNHVTVRGCVALGQWAVQQKIAIRNPLRYAEGLIRQQLAKANIALEGTVILGKAPTGAMLIAVDASKPISQLMADTLKPSDNLYADSLYLHAADKLHGSPVNWEQAEPIIRQFLQQQTGISLDKAVLADGSGLSRNDRITAHQTVSLLRFLYDRFPLSYEYIAALPISGRDGTLQRRFKKPNQQDLVRAKTGTMTGVISLSGYLYTANDHTLAFSIFLNRLPNTPASVSGRFRYLVDTLCAYFLQQKPSEISWARVFTRYPAIQYQLSPTQAEQQRGKQAKWRRLEMLVKQALRGQAVTVIYRGNELILHDNQREASVVMSKLANLRAKYPFSVALVSKTLPPLTEKSFVFWMESNALPPGVQRVWTIREAML